VDEPDFARLSINTATFGWERDLRSAVEALDRADIRAIVPWRKQVQACGTAEAARILRDFGMTVNGYCRAGFFTGESGAAPGDALDEVCSAIDEATEIGASSLTLVVGGLPSGSKDLGMAHQMVRDGLAAALPYARASGMPLAIEPLHPMYAADRGCVNSLAHANALCEELGDGIGIAIDVYHVWWDPHLEREVARAGHDRLLGFHLCDWLVPTSHMLLDRGMMGDGVADIHRIRNAVEAAGYGGYYEVEIFSAANWWRRDPDELLRVCKERFLTAC
jgi:sugar phosphate isomerase/epimerase